MTTKHTPAPWRVSRADKDGAEVSAIASVAWCGRASHVGLTETQVIDADEARANAQLISAAPDLLTMCEELLPELACHCDEGFTSRGRHAPNTLCHYYDDLKAVIAKAKGEPHAR